MPSKKSTKRPSDVARPATLADVEGIVRLNAEAYPRLAEIGLTWTPHHVEAQLRTFPEGQAVVERDGRIVASCSSLVVDLGRDAYRDHTWAGITDSGMFYNHDPFGDTLYGADVNVHPDVRRQGLGGALYAHRRELCRSLNLRRIVVGGRLMLYSEHSAEMTAGEYARRVESGELSDPVLSFQLAQGFVLKKILPSYMRDPLSEDHGTFLEWINPDYRSRPRKARSVRVSCVQYQMRRIDDFEGFARQVRFFVDVAKAYDSDFVLFPELLTAQLMSYLGAKTALQAIHRLTELTERVDALFVELAREFQVAIIGGTHPIRTGSSIHNVATLYLRDGRSFRQPKIHVTPNEARHWGIVGGDRLQVFDTGKARVGILVCYDSEFPEAARYLADQGAEVIFVPFCTDDRQAYLRVRYCSQARAVENQVYVVMAGTVGNLPDVENMDIQYAQSCVLSPSDFEFARDGILVEAQPNTETVITTDLDFEALEEAVHAGSVRQRRDRRPDLFRFVATLPREGGDETA
jgi:predicted amidohydrolase/GNAT superfamily N-acetyltransferase